VKVSNLISLCDAQPAAYKVKPGLDKSSAEISMIFIDINHAI
jgi:hypothetical protein